MNREHRIPHAYVRPLIVHDGVYEFSMVLCAHEWLQLLGYM